jgi:hypothetical protein
MTQLSSYVRKQDIAAGYTRLLAESWTSTPLAGGAHCKNFMWLSLADALLEAAECVPTIHHRRGLLVYDKTTYGPYLLSSLISQHSKASFF